MYHTLKIKGQKIEFNIFCNYPYDTDTEWDNICPIRKSDCVACKYCKAETNDVEILMKLQD